MYVNAFNKLMPIYCVRRYGMYEKLKKKWNNQNDNDDKNDFQTIRLYNKTLCMVFY